MKVEDKARLAAFKECYRFLRTCCMDGETEARVAASVKCYAFEESEPDGANGGAVTKLASGRYAAFEEWQDYTGHGCQCSCWSSEHATLKEAKELGLSRETRELLFPPRGK